jgi:hypothetical protein
MEMPEKKIETEMLVLRAPVECHRARERLDVGT